MELGLQMKSVGEVMAIGRSFIEATESLSGFGDCLKRM
jgi:carbamoylphosphate synthase large subunit